MEDIPVPIPNTEVKLHSAESSWGIAPCEGRTLPCGGLAQLGERLPYKQRVTGSSPVSSILLSDSAELFNIWLMMAVVAKWLTHRIVAPARVGSIPTYRPC